MAAAVKLTEDYLTCIVCTEVFNDPATLHCDHTFCRPCLLKYIKTQPDAIKAKSIPCPSCRQMTKVTFPEKPIEDWVNQVKLSRIMRGLMEDFGPGVDTTAFSTCSVCKEDGQETPATVWCSDCEAAFCDTCGRYHRKMPNARNHDVHGLSSDVKPKPSRRYICRIHEDEQVKLFCKDCKKAICHTCCSIHHRACSTVVTIKEVLPEITSNLLTRKQNLDKQTTDGNRKITKLKYQISTALEETVKVEAEINLASEKAIYHVRAKEKTLLAKLKEISERHTGKLKSEIKTEEITRQVHMQESQYIEEVVKAGSLVDTVDMYEKCKTELSTSETEFETGIKPTMSISFKWDIDRLSEYLNAMYLGEVTFANKTRTSSPILCRTIDTKTSTDSNEPIIKDIAVISVTGMKVLVVTDCIHNKVKTFYTRDNQSHQSELKLDYTPFGITTLEENKVLVSTPGSNQIHELLVFPKLKSNIVKASTGSYYGLQQIHKNKLVACKYVQGSSSVDFTDMKGTVLSTLKDRSVQSPDFVCVIDQGLILVTDRESKSLIFISVEGRVVNKYAPTGDKALRAPRGIVLADSGDILLVDMNAHKVIQLTPSGEFVRDILTSDDGLTVPHGITIDEDGLLYVTDEKYVKVFSFK